MLNTLLTTSGAIMVFSPSLYCIDMDMLAKCSSRTKYATRIPNLTKITILSRETNPKLTTLFQNGNVCTACFYKDDNTLRRASQDDENAQKNEQQH